MPPAPVRGRHDQLGGGGLDGVGVLQLCVTGQLTIGDEQEMPDALTVPAPQLQPPLLGNGLPAIGPGGLTEKGEDGVGLLGGERVESLDLAPGGGEGCVSRHDYERTGRRCRQPESAPASRCRTS